MNDNANLQPFPKTYTHTHTGRCVIFISYILCYSLATTHAFFFIHNLFEKNHKIYSIYKTLYIIYFDHCAYVLDKQFYATIIY